MFEDLAKDIRDNITEKLSKPFGGTFVFTWVLHNWVLLYTLFNFDSGTLLNKKLSNIDTLIHEAGWCQLLWAPILWAFFAIILYLALSNISLVISLAFSKYVRPWIYNKMDQNQIVDKKFYDEQKDSLRKLQQEKDDAENRLSTLIRDNTNLQKATFEANDQYKQLISTLTSVNNDKLNLHEEKVRIENELATYKTKQEKELEFENNIGNNIDEVFDGIWQNDFQFPDGRKGQERFHVTDSQYFLHSEQSLEIKLEFNLKNVVVDKSRKFLYFQKVRLDGSPATEDYLFFENDKKLIGFESNGVRLSYTRLESNPVKVRRKAIIA